MLRLNTMPCLPRIGLAVIVLAVAAGCASIRAGMPAANASGHNATLRDSYPFQVTAIDITMIYDSFHSFDGRDQTLDLAPGQHTLILRYFYLIRNDPTEPTTTRACFQSRSPSRLLCAWLPAIPVVGAHPRSGCLCRIYRRSRAIHPSL